MRTIKSDNEFNIIVACKQSTGNFIRIHYGLSPQFKNGEKEISPEFKKRLMDFEASITIGTFMYAN